MKPQQNFLRVPCVPCVLSGVLLLSLAGCNEPAKTGGNDAPPLNPPQPYAEIAAAYNQRVQVIERIWSRAVVEVEWIDKAGKKQLEQGEGPLIVRKPGELALAIGKVGITRFWLGCDDEYYWFFDLPDNNRTAYFGRQDQIAHEQSQSLPLPLRPDQLIRLAGVTALPTFDDPSAADAVKVERIAGGHRITLPPEQGFGGLVMRTTIDADYHATRIELLTSKGQLMVDATLSAFKRMEITGQPPGAWPSIARRIRVALPQHKAQVTLFIEKLTDDPDKVKDAQFDFKRLVKLLKVDRTLDIDKEKPRR